MKLLVILMFAMSFIAIVFVRKRKADNPPDEDE